MTGQLWHLTTSSVTTAPSIILSNFSTLVAQSILHQQAMHMPEPVGAQAYATEVVCSEAKAGVCKISQAGSKSCIMVWLRGDQNLLATKAQKMLTDHAADNVQGCCYVVNIADTWLSSTMAISALRTLCSLQQYCRRFMGELLYSLLHHGHHKCTDDNLHGPTLSKSALLVHGQTKRGHPRQP